MLTLLRLVSVAALRARLLVVAVLLAEQLRVAKAALVLLLVVEAELRAAAVAAETAARLPVRARSLAFSFVVGHAFCLILCVCPLLYRKRGTSSGLEPLRPPWPDMARQDAEKFAEKIFSGKNLGHLGPPWATSKAPTGMALHTVPPWAPIQAPAEAICRQKKN
jgi:hypothetical protein